MDASQLSRQAGTSRNKFKDEHKQTSRCYRAITATDGSYTITSRGGGTGGGASLPQIPVTTLHLSCASDVYDGTSKNYAGFVLYSHNGQTSWTLNGKKCKSGYIVIQDTDSSNVQRYRAAGSPGVVHGAVYRNVFGEDIGKSTVGEGFAVMDGEMKWNSYTFNAPRDSVYHDHCKDISQVARDNIEKVLQEWKDAGMKSHSLPTERNFTVPQH